jgi:N-acetylglucosamine kinase-like BadF-type ATPase
VVYILGIDGGGSKTEAAIIDDNDRVLGCSVAGGSNTNFVERSEAVKSFVTAIKGALEEAGLQPSQIAGAGCTFGGVASDAFAEIGLCVKPVGVSECRVAFERAGLERMYGVALIAGTGSSCFGFGPEGQRFHAGGHGPLLGDEGGGYDIGIRGARIALQSYEGRKPPTMLIQAACEYFDVPNIRLLVHKLAGSCIRQTLIAGFAARVSDCARRGDQLASEILQYAGSVLGELVAFVASRVFSSDDEFPVVMAGGVFKAGDLVIEPLKSVVTAQFPKARLIVGHMNPGEAVARVTKRVLQHRERFE